MGRHTKAGKLYSFESFKVYEYDEDRTYNGHDDDFGTSKRSKLLKLNRKNKNILLTSASCNIDTYFCFVLSKYVITKISQLLDHANNNETSYIEIANYHLKGRQLSIVMANKATFASCFIYFTAVKRFVVHLVDSSHESLMKSDHNRYLYDVTS